MQKLLALLGAHVGERVAQHEANGCAGNSEKNIFKFSIAHL